MAKPSRPQFVLTVLLLVSLLSAAAGLIGADPFVAHAAGRADPLSPLVGAMDFVTFKEISNFLLGAIIVALSGLALTIRRWRPVARLSLYVGTVQFASTTICDLAKPIFGRLRPHELAPGQADSWFVGANSFPSGHAGFYAGLVFPVIALWPRAWPLAAVPVLVAAQRVMAQDHYLSDVSASLALAAILALVLRPIAGTRPAGAASSRSR